MPVMPDLISDPETVPLGMLRRYLATHGWRRASQTARPVLARPQSAAARAVLQGRSGGQRNFDLYVLSEDGLDDVELILPRGQGSTDYVRQVLGAIRTLSDIEGRAPEEVVTDVRLIGFDVVRSRIPNALVYDNTIQLEIASNYITGIKSLLAATATTEIQPDPYFLRVKKEAADYADHCRFGHTFKSSFGFTIESPILPNDEPTFAVVDQPTPFNRRVMERLVRGIRSVCEAVATDDTAALVANARTGFNANACEQFATLVTDTSPGSLLFGFSFSPEWQAPADLTQAGEFTVGPRHVEVTRAAAQVLRQQVLPRSENVTGRVIRLESNADPSNLLNPKGEREIIVQWSHAEMGDIAVRMSLAPPEYLLAVEAHKAGRTVSVSGTLERRGRAWILTGSTDFCVQ